MSPARSAFARALLFPPAEVLLTDVTCELFLLRPGFHCTLVLIWVLLVHVRFALRVSGVCEMLHTRSGVSSKTPACHDVHCHDVHL